LGGLIEAGIYISWTSSDTQNSGFPINSKKSGRLANQQNEKILNSKNLQDDILVIPITKQPDKEGTVTVDFKLTKCVSKVDFLGE